MTEPIPARALIEDRATFADAIHALADWIDREREREDNFLTDALTEMHDRVIATLDTASPLGANETSRAYAVVHDMYSQGGDTEYAWGRIESEALFNGWERDPDGWLGQIDVQLPDAWGLDRYQLPADGYKVFDDREEIDRSLARLARLTYMRPEDYRGPIPHETAIEIEADALIGTARYGYCLSAGESARMERIVPALTSGEQIRTSRLGWDDAQRRGEFEQAVLANNDAYDGWLNDRAIDMDMAAVDERFQQMADREMAAPARPSPRTPIGELTGAYIVELEDPKMRHLDPKSWNADQARFHPRHAEFDTREQATGWAIQNVPDRTGDEDRQFRVTVYPREAIRADGTIPEESVLRVQGTTREVWGVVNQWWQNDFRNRMAEESNVVADLRAELAHAREQLADAQRELAVAGGKTSGPHQGSARAVVSDPVLGPLHEGGDRDGGLARVWAAMAAQRPPVTGRAGGQHTGGEHPPRPESPPPPLQSRMYRDSGLGR